MKKSDKLKRKLRKAGHSKKLIKSTVQVYKDLRGMRKAAEKKEAELSWQQLGTAVSQLDKIVQQAARDIATKDLYESYGKKITDGLNINSH